jgi:hypothetical protein
MTELTGVLPEMESEKSRSQKRVGKYRKELRNDGNVGVEYGTWLK